MESAKGETNEVAGNQNNNQGRDLDNPNKNIDSPASVGHWTSPSTDETEFDIEPSYIISKTHGLPLNPASTSIQRGSQPAALGDINVGITSYSLGGFTRYDDIYEYYFSGEFQAFLYDLQSEAQGRGLEITALEPAGGIWWGNFEPSISVWITGDVEETKLLCVALGRKYNQESVIFFAPHPHGKGRLYTLHDIKDVDATIALMKKYNIPGRFLSTRDVVNLEIADKADGKLRPLVFMLIDELAGTWSFVHGQVEERRCVG
jgi:hypothetical protein